MRSLVIVFSIFLIAFFTAHVFAEARQPNPDSIPFAPAVKYGVGDTPKSVFCADLDGDGDLDLAVANERGNVSILKNNGDGIFQSAVNYPLSRYNSSVFCADLDGDGDLDLAVGHNSGVAIFKNNGDGTFQSAVFYDGSTCPYSVFCADLDGDGDLDLATANYEGGDVTIFKNNGDGTFQSAVHYGAIHLRTSIFCAKLDGDDDMDLAVVNYNNGNVSIFKNNGDGTFQNEVDYGAGSYPHSVFCADLDGDTYVDLAVANQDGVSILKNNGDGTFQIAVNYMAGDAPWSVFSADIDGDNDLDLAVANNNSNNVSILKNNGDGTFQSAVNYGAGYGPSSVFCADLDGDGDMDLAIANPDSDNVSILRNLTSEHTPSYFVHITDPHVGYGPLHPFASLRWALAIDYLKNLDDPPDFVLCTGDLVDFGYGPLASFNWELLLAPLYKRNSTFYLDENYRIPIYFCPGNHDAAKFDPSWYIFWKPIDFDQYHENIGPDYYVVKHKNCAIFSMNSGKDANWPNAKPAGDGLGEQYGNEVTNLPLDLDALDGQLNGTDSSYYYKIVMMHHPYLNPRDPANPQYPEAFWYGRGGFINAVYNYDVDLFLCGHIHDGGDCGVKNRYGQDWHSGDGTKFEITNSLDGPFSGRNIRVVPVGPKGFEEIDSVFYFRSTLCFQIDGEAIVHVYDQYGNHDGPNEEGEIEINIPGSSYHYWISDSLVPNPVYTEFSVFKEDTTDYSFKIESLIDDTVNIVASSYLTNGIWNKARYDSVSVQPGSVASLHAKGSILDYTMTILDPDSSVREVTPSNWQGNLPPAEPTIPLGPTMVVSNDSPTYKTCSIDPENDQISYKFDWGDETHSDWQGPLNSGDTCVAYHSWVKAGMYNVRVRAIDIWDHMGGWSDTSLVTVRDRGDATGDGLVNAGDVVYLVNYLFRGGPAPNPLQAGDATCNGIVDAGDVVFLINYLFKGGTAPSC
ncbi:MAG: FG-GAP-like repeat-containing protein [Candidatus Zixiibacteriota bacterium]